MTQQEMMLLVPRKLKEIEKEYGVRVLYAVESGSRAWGTHGPQSDYDVRFIYIRPREDYLRLEQPRDVLEFPIDDGWDMAGWDLRKTLQLLHNANSQIYEWFGSPVVYVDDGFSKRFRPLLDAYFSTKTAVMHYLHQADRKRKQQDRAEQTKVKHYLYGFQHLSSARWILDHQAPPPVDYRKLIGMLPEDARVRALEMLELKKTTPLIPHDSWMPGCWRSGTVLTCCWSSFPGNRNGIGKCWTGSSWKSWNGCNQADFYQTHSLLLWRKAMGFVCISANLLIFKNVGRLAPAFVL